MKNRTIWILCVIIIAGLSLDYVITSSYFALRYFLRESQIEYPEVTKGQINFYNSSDKYGTLPKVFENNQLDKPGPTIKIYKLLG